MAVAQKTRKKREETSEKPWKKQAQERPVDFFVPTKENKGVERKRLGDLTEEEYFAELNSLKKKLGIEDEPVEEIETRQEEGLFSKNSDETYEDLALQQARKRIEEDRNGEHGFFRRIWVRLREGKYLERYYNETLSEIEVKRDLANQLLAKAESVTGEEEIKEVEKLERKSSQAGEFFKKLKGIVGKISYDKIALTESQRQEIEKLLDGFSEEDQEYFFSGKSDKEDVAKLRKITKAVLGSDPKKWAEFIKNENVGAYGGALSLEFRSEDVLDSIGSTDHELAQEIKDLKKRIFERNAVDVFLAPTEQGGLLESVDALRIAEDKGGEVAVKEADEKFKQILREKIKTVAVHKVGYGNKAEDISDWDGEASLKLFELAGFKADAKYVDKGSFEKGVLNSDTGMYDGIARDGDTFYIDHHGKESERDSSACKYTWQFLKNFGFFEGKSEKEIKAMERMVEFITETDNCNYDKHDFKSIFENSYQNLTGYTKSVKLDRLLAWFTNPLNELRSPYDDLSDQELGYLMGIDNPEELNKKIEARKGIVEGTEKEFEKLRDEGFIINSKEYGNVFVASGEYHLNGGVDAAIALGAGVFIVWNPPGFMISFISKEIKPEHEIALDELINKGKSSTERIRRMYFKPQKNYRIKLRASIADILKILTDTDGAYVSGSEGMKKLIIDERKQLKEDKRPIKKN